MYLLHMALRRPVSIIVGVISIALCAVLALTRMSVDIFPNLNMPVIYVIQPYGGMDPLQMEGYLTVWYEDHFFYINGIKAVESRCIEQVSMMKLTFHPGTDMAEAMANTVAQVERAKAFMPPGTVGPFVMRFDAGSVPAGYLVMSSNKRDVNQLQDMAITVVRPMLASLPGVSGAPAFGGNQRTIVVTVDPERLRAYQMSPEDVVQAVAANNIIVPNGDVRVGDYDRMSPVNAVVDDIHDLDMMPVKVGHGPTVFLRDLGSIKDSADILTGYALVNGRRTVYIPVVKLGNASTLAVVNEVKAALPGMHHSVPEDVKISFEFDQSVYVTSAITNLVNEGLHGALLTGLMVLLFLKDFRSAIVVLTSIPTAILTAVTCLWLSGQTINIMTLGGLALAIGILVDEATVTIENIHTHLDKGENLKLAVFNAGKETITPRFLAMMSVISVFVPSFFMEGATQSLFVPLSLAVGFSMMASYILSSTLVPVISIWFLKVKPHKEESAEKPGFFSKVQEIHHELLNKLIAIRWVACGAYFAGFILISAVVFPILGSQIFPTVDTGQFEIRIKAPVGTRFEKTETISLAVLNLIKQEAGEGNVQISIGYVGTQPPNYALSNMYVFTNGPHEAVLTVALRPEAHIRLEEFKERIRKKVPEMMPDVLISFQAGDIVSKIMNFGSPTPIEVSVTGMKLNKDRAFADKVLAEMKKIPVLRDVQYEQALDYPTIDINIDRERTGQMGINLQQVGNALTEATSSSRWIKQNYWRDPTTGVSYQLQVELPQWHVGSLSDIENVPTMRKESGDAPYVRDVAAVHYGVIPGEIDHFNQKRQLSLQANIAGNDVGRAATAVQEALDRVGAPPQEVFVNISGQVPTMKETFFGLQVGIGLAIVVILLMLTANFQSMPLALVVLSVIPAIIAGELVALLLTGTTLNVQSYMGGIMAIGVGVSNSILLITFAEDNRLNGLPAKEAGLEAARERLRPVLMTSIAMISGMVPMALSADAQASLARAVIGGLVMSTPTVLIILPVIFSLARANTGRTSASLHYEDATAQPVASSSQPLANDK